MGFLNWSEESSKDDKNYSSPILLLPIEIKQEKTLKGFKYSVYSNNDFELNPTLKITLENKFGLNLPELEEEDTYSTYVKKLSENIEKKFPKWTIKNFVTFGFFPFKDIVIHNDLNPELWGDGVFQGHEEVSILLAGKNENPVTRIEEIEDIDEKTLLDNVPDLVLQADSSQHTSVIEALKGKSLVIQGPPGTGKSQTIANLISSFVMDGKRVLFLAEKQPALDVVKKRLENINLGPILFEPQRTNKDEMYDELKKRLEIKTKSPESYVNKINKVKNLISENRNFRDLLFSETSYKGLYYYKLIWKFINLSSKLKKHIHKDIPYSSSVENTTESLREYDQKLKLCNIHNESDSQKINLNFFKKLAQ